MSDSGKAVFLSYASQDAEAARRICEALRAAGVEVWFDQNELVGGDAWDAKIRGQIGSCALFIPIISASTQARLEGYFRREWKQAASRTYDMADEKTFLLPVVIDDTRDPEAKVPAEFKAVQWTRLPGGEATPAFCARVKKLLGGETGTTAPLPSGRTDSRPATEPTPAGRSFRLAPVILALVATLVALALWRPWRSSESPPSVVSPVPAAPVSEARQLAERARTIMGKGDLTREQLETANELCERALRLDPADAIAWSEAAHADLLLVHPYGYDRSEERRKRAQFRATRALNLAPDELEVRVMRAAVLAHAGGTPALLAEAAADFRELIASHPGDRRLVFQLAEVLREQLRFEEAARQFESIGEWELAGWSYYQAGKPLLALAAVERSLREKRAVSALQLKAILQCRVVQDLDAAQATLDQLRPSELLTEMQGATALDIALLRRDPARMLEILRGLTTDYFQSYAFTGPRQFFTGTAHSLAGRRSLAENEWRAGLALLQERLKSAPGDRHLLLWAAWFQATLGQKDEAQRLLDQAREADRQERAGGERYSDKVSTVVRFSDMVLLALGRSEEALAQLSELFRTKPLFWEDKHTTARFDPAYDPLRGDARFEKLLRDNLPEGAKPFDDQQSAVSNQQSASDLKPQAPSLTPSSPFPPDSKSVAVLAFANLSDDKGNEYFSDGISEELLNVLAKVPGLKVSARTSAFYFKGKEVPIPEIARQLGVAYVVEGSVRKQGDKVRITAQLIKAADGFHVWSDTFTRDLKDIFAVQDEIAALIAQNLQLKMDLAPVKRVVNPDAHRLVLEGRHYWLQRTDEAFARAQELYAKALEIDPEFAEAHAGIADVFVVRGWYHALSGASVTAADFTRAREEANIALRLDPTRPEPHASLAAVNYNEGRFPEAELAFKEALRLNPNYAVALHWRSHLLMAQGRPDEALASIERSIELDPFSSITLVIYANWLEHTGRNADAVAVTDRAMALRTDQFVPLYGTRALALWNVGRREEAVAAARVVTRDPKQEPRWWTDGGVVYVLREAGLVAEARAHRDSMLGELREGSTARAAVFAGMEEPERAIAELGRPERRLAGPGETFYATTWATTRADPRYAQLMEKLGRGEAYRRAQETLRRMKGGEK